MTEKALKKYINFDHIESEDILVSTSDAVSLLARVDSEMARYVEPDRRWVRMACENYFSKSHHSDFHIKLQRHLHYSHDSAVRFCNKKGLTEKDFKGRDADDIFFEFKPDRVEYLLSFSPLVGLEQICVSRDTINSFYNVDKITRNRRYHGKVITDGWG